MPIPDDRLDRDPPPLCGIRVLDLTRVLAGPYCTMLLADLGAEVVKVERHEVGDDARHFGPFLPGGLSAYFASINRGKKSITLDLKQANDRDLFLRLVKQADVVVENFRAGTMASFGLPVEKLQEIQPQLIYASLSGFGHHGLDTDRAAYDIVIQALSGLMSITGAGPGQFVRVGTSISDILTGLFAAIAILAALRRREATGSGTVVDMAMLDCTVAALENAVSRFAVTGASPEPLGTRHPSITPFQSFRASDGSMVVAAGNQSLWRQLCTVLGCPTLVGDPRFATNDLRTQNCEELSKELNSRFGQHDIRHWLEQLSAAGVPSAPIRNVEEVVGDAHLASRGMLHEMDDGAGGRSVTAGSPFHLNGQPPQLADHCPALGEDTESVLNEWLG